MKTVNTIVGKSSLFKLSEYRFVKTLISLGENKLNGNVETKMEVVSIKEDEEHVFHTRLNVSIYNEDKTLNIESSLIGRFVVEDPNFKYIERLMKVDAVIYLYPYMRSYISALTSLSNIPSFDLPVIEDSFFKEQYKKKDSDEK